MAFISGLLAHSMARDQSLDSSRSPCANQVKHIVATPRTAREAARSSPGTCSTCGPTRCSLRQVLDNLIGNALKYVAPGTVPASWSRPSAAERRMGVRQVRDNGIGVPAAQRERIFESFQRATGEDYRGTGLGPRDLPADHPAARRQHPGHRQPRRHRQLLRVHPATTPAAFERAIGARAITDDPPVATTLASRRPVRRQKRAGSRYSPHS